MKTTGVVRKIGDLGRIVLPMEVRKGLGIEDKESLEIFTDEDMIILKKLNGSCVICGSSDNLIGLQF